MSYDPNQDQWNRYRQQRGGIMLLLVAGLAVIAGLVFSMSGEWTQDTPATSIVEKNSATTGQH